MADRGYIRNQLAAIPDAATKQVLTNIFEYFLANLRLGAPMHQTRAENLQAYWEKSTTASDTSEFTVAHGMDSTPRYAIPVLDLNQVGARIVPLEVSRVADKSRLYLKTSAGSTNASILLLIE